MPVEPTPWPDDRAERVSVNSYGIGGSNVHVSSNNGKYHTENSLTNFYQFVIDSAASFGIKALTSPKLNAGGKRRKNILLFSANHHDALKKVAENIQEYLVKYPERVDDLAYTLARRREHLKLRSYAVVTDSLTPLEVSAQIKYQGPRTVAFVFTGQGAQW